MAISYVQDGRDVASATLSAVIQGRGVSFATTSSSGPVRIGYATVVSAPEDAVAVSSAFSQIVPGRPLFKAFVPLSSVLHAEFFVPFLNSNGQTASLAILSLTPQSLSLIARNQSGIELCRASLSLGGGRHDAFILHERLPCTRGADGLLHVQGTALGLSAFGLTAQDDGAFVTQPVYSAAP